MAKKVITFNQKIYPAYIGNLIDSDYIEGGLHSVDNLNDIIDPVEGMLAYLKGDGEYYKYDGTKWVLFKAASKAEEVSYEHELLKEDEYNVKEALDILFGQVFPPTNWEIKSITKTSDEKSIGDSSEPTWYHKTTHDLPVDDIVTTVSYELSRKNPVKKYKIHSLDYKIGDGDWKNIEITEEEQGKSIKTGNIEIKLSDLTDDTKITLDDDTTKYEKTLTLKLTTITDGEIDDPLEEEITIRANINSANYNSPGKWNKISEFRFQYEPHIFNGTITLQDDAEIVQVTESTTELVFEAGKEIGLNPVYVDLTKIPNKQIIQYINGDSGITEETLIWTPKLTNYIDTTEFTGPKTIKTNCTFGLEVATRNTDKVDVKGEYPAPSDKKTISIKFPQKDKYFFSSNADIKTASDIKSSIQEFFNFTNEGEITSKGNYLYILSSKTGKTMQNYSTGWTNFGEQVTTSPLTITKGTFSDRQVNDVSGYYLYRSSNKFDEGNTQKIKLG